MVDANTIFASLIFKAADVNGVECFPRPVMIWSESFYSSVFAPHGDFSLREHGVASSCHCICICCSCFLTSAFFRHTCMYMHAL